MSLNYGVESVQCVVCTANDRWHSSFIIKMGFTYYRHLNFNKKNQKQTKTKAKAIKKFQIQLNARKEIT